MLTASERKWPVRWADVRGEERVTSLRTSAWEAKLYVYFEFHVGSPWTRLAELIRRECSPTKPCLRILIILFIKKLCLFFLFVSSSFFFSSSNFITLSVILQLYFSGLIYTSTGSPSARSEEIIHVNETHAKVTLAFEKCCVTKMRVTRVCMGTLRVCFKYLNSDVLWIKLTYLVFLSYSLLFHGVWGHSEAFSAS